MEADMSKYTAASDLDYLNECGNMTEDAPVCSECESADCPHATDDNAYCDHDPDFSERAPDCPPVPR